jgi:hypothetical protein
MHDGFNDKNNPLIRRTGFASKQIGSRYTKKSKNLVSLAADPSLQ